jgi:hypothetical protein
MRRRRWMTAGLALVGGGAAAALIPILPAVGQSSPPSSPIILANTGQIVAKGAAAVVGVQVACAAGDQAQVQVTLTEKSGSGLANGTAYQTVACNGQIEQLSMTVVAFGSKPFGVGTAYGQSSLFDFFNGTSGSDNHNVTLKK